MIKVLNNYDNTTIKSTLYKLLQDKFTVSYENFRSLFYTLSQIIKTASFPGEHRIKEKISRQVNKTDYQMLRLKNESGTTQKPSAQQQYENKNTQKLSKHIPSKPDKYTSLSQNTGSNLFSDVSNLTTSTICLEYLYY